MKLSSDDLSNLTRLLATCSVCNIDSVIIADGLIRGVNESKTCALISGVNVPAFSQRIGLARIGALKSRLDLFSSNNQTVINTRESERGEITMLEISSGRNNVQFRCTATSLIKAPSSINDEPCASVFLDRQEVRSVLDAVRVMGSKKVSIVVRPSGDVSVELCDASNDSFKIGLKNPVEFLSEPLTSTVVQYYQADIFSSIFRNIDSDVCTLILGVAGTLSVDLNSHAVTLIPQINENGDD